MLIQTNYDLAHLGFIIMVFYSIMIGILQTWMVKAGLGVVGGADAVDWQDEPQEVSGEEEVAAVRTGNQVDKEHY